MFGKRKALLHICNSDISAKARWMLGSMEWRRALKPPSGTATLPRSLQVARQVSRRSSTPTLQLKRFVGCSPGDTLPAMIQPSALQRCSELMVRK